MEIIFGRFDAYASLPIVIAVIYRYANVVANSNRLAEAFVTADYYKLTGSTI